MVVARRGLEVSRDHDWRWWRKKKNRWVGGRRGANVRAKTDLTVTVMNGRQMQWILEHDYGADGEMAKAIKDRKKEMDRAQKVN